LYWGDFLGISIGESKALQFPVMCDAFIRIDYDKYNPIADAASEEELRTGVYGNEGQMLLEAIITPYDINGYGTYDGYCGRNAPTVNVGVSDSQKTMPALNTQSDSDEIKYSQSEEYLPQADRRNHKMMLFYNPHFQVYLQNTTTATGDTLHNVNQPSEYKICFTLGLLINNAISEYTLESDAVILPSTKVYNKYESLSLYNTNEDSTEIQKAQVFNAGVNEAIRSSCSNSSYTNQSACEGAGETWTDGSSTYTATHGVYFDGDISSSATITVGSLSVDPRKYFGVGNKVYTYDGSLLGTIASLTSSTIVLTSAITVDVSDYPSSRVELYREQHKEATYINNVFHIAAGVSPSGVMGIFLNGKKIKETRHTGITSTFEFYLDDADSYIGADASGTDANRRITQFMGVLYELSISKKYKEQFETNNILTNYDDILLYYRFVGDKHGG